MIIRIPRLPAVPKYVSKFDLKWLSDHSKHLRKLSYSKVNFKDKSPEVPFHKITSSYSYFEFLRQFSLVCKKAKYCWALSTNFLFLLSWYFFLIMFCFLLNWRKNSNCFKIAVWRSGSMKRNFRGFIFNFQNLWCIGMHVTLRGHS